MFRPVARSTAERDYVLELLLAHDGVDLDYDECVGVTYDEVHDDPDAALSRIVDRFKAVERKCDAVVIVGSDYTDVATPTELALQRPHRGQPGRTGAARAHRPGREPDESPRRRARPTSSGRSPS